MLNKKKNYNENDYENLKQKIENMRKYWIKLMKIEIRKDKFINHQFHLNQNDNRNIQEIK
jgi:hypothetical protein